MIGWPSQTRVFLALGVTDMRKEINGLSVLVEGQLELDPFTGCLFVFCNRRRTTVKVLFWDRNGFALYQKRLEGPVQVAGKPGGGDAGHRQGAFLPS
jgi:transposase